MPPRPWRLYYITVQFDPTKDFFLSPGDEIRFCNAPGTHKECMYFILPTEMSQMAGLRFPLRLLKDQLLPSTEIVVHGMEKRTNRDTSTDDTDALSDEDLTETKIDDWMTSEEAGRTTPTCSELAEEEDREGDLDPNLSHAPTTPPHCKNQGSRPRQLMSTKSHEFFVPRMTLAFWVIYWFLNLHRTLDYTKSTKKPCCA